MLVVQSMLYGRWPKSANGWRVEMADSRSSQDEQSLVEKAVPAVVVLGALGAFLAPSSGLRIACLLAIVVYAVVYFLARNRRLNA